MIDLGDIDAYKLATPPEYEQDEPREDDSFPGYESLVYATTALNVAAREKRDRAVDAYKRGDMETGQLYEQTAEHLEAVAGWLAKGAP